MNETHFLSSQRWRSSDWNVDKNIILIYDVNICYRKGIQEGLWTRRTWVVCSNYEKESNKGFFTEDMTWELYLKPWVAFYSIELARKEQAEENAWWYDSPCYIREWWVKDGWSMVVVLRIVKIWKQPKCPSVDEWIKKLWYIYTMEYYSDVKKKETLPFATAWMNLENIMLSEISPAKKNKYHMIALICGI